MAFVDVDDDDKDNEAAENADADDELRRGAPPYSPLGIL